MDTNLPISSSAIPRDNGKFIWRTAKSLYRGTNFIAEVHWEDVRNTPQWNGSDKPPVSLDKAESIAAVGLEHQLGRPPSQVNSIDLNHIDVKPWMLIEVSIHRIGGWHFWCYELKMEPHLNGSYNWDPVTVYVTMDGHMIPLRQY
jgi:hypothetical protein